MSLSFTCPRCRALLKIRDESFVGIELACPECQTALRVARSETGEVFGQDLTAEQPLPSAATTKQRKPKAATPGRESQTSKSKRSIPQPALRPTTQTGQFLPWIVAGVFLLVLIPFLLPSRKPRPSAPVAVQKDPPKQNASDKSVEVAKDDRATPDDSRPPPLPDTAAGRLKELGKQVFKQAEADKHFPAGTVSVGDLNPMQRWSWLAQLASRQDNPAGTIVPWNQRWNDPAHDRFVRRSIPRFQNPQVKTAVSEDRYPASHFVGVSGVGVDAATLPVDHPRAGIFGQDRQTKADQIRDGLSNTMLLAGVEDHLGSWAAGSASYRSFTQIPYIHGPDGFGTGQPHEMFVLMADGSVREINQKTDPRIVRRMAAMNDGLPLDIKVPGEPGDVRPATVPMPDPVAGKTPPDKNVAQVKPPEPQPPDPEPVAKPIDIHGALSRKVLKFDQSKPAAAFKLILQIEELDGVRIEYDRQQLGDAAERLDKQITLRKENASLEELLDDVLKQIDLQRKSEATCIRIIAAEST